MNLTPLNRLKLSQLFSVFVFALVLSVLPSHAQAIPGLCKWVHAQPKTVARTGTVEDRVLAVHLTKFLPKEGYVRASTENRGRFGITLHFTLGQPVIDHSAGSWKDRTYGVVLPLSSMREQVLNIFPQDTFVLGDVKIPSDGVVFVPRGEKLPPSVPFRVVRYNPEVGLKQSIDDYIANSKMIRFEAQGGNTKDAVYVNGKDIRKNIRGFFKQLTSERPQVTSTIHESTVWGSIDNSIIVIFARLLRNGTPTRLTTTEIYLAKLSIEDSVTEASKIIRSMEIPTEAKESVRTHFFDLKRYLNIADADLSLRKNHSVSYLATDFSKDPTLRDKIYDIAGDKVKLQKILEENIHLLAKVADNQIVTNPMDVMRNMPHADLALFNRVISEMFPRPGKQVKAEIDNATIWKMTQALAKNQISSHEALAIWKEKISKDNMSRIKVWAIPEMMKLIDSERWTLSTDIIDFLRNPAVLAVIEPKYHLKSLGYGKDIQSDRMEKIFTPEVLEIRQRVANKDNAVQVY